MRKKCSQKGNTGKKREREKDEKEKKRQNGMPDR
jgi:hypothetical protein